MGKERASFRYLFDGDRKSIKAQAAEEALRLVLGFLP
jgi:nicotinamide mononucleotide (NMN) deamidase PncC